MKLQERIALLGRLGRYLLEGSEEWTAAKEKAGYQNGWFIPEFIDLAARNIARDFLETERLEKWVRIYAFPEEQPAPMKIGLVMAGNIPLVGFHDWMCVFLSGHIAVVKPSSKDDVLIRHLVTKIEEWSAKRPSSLSSSPPASSSEYNHTVFQPMLKDCDAYIATGSNNSAGYFEYYFKRFPHIIRRNRSSVAILNGSESPDQLDRLADDVFQYFGLGCRNVTKLIVPRDYDFVPLINVFKRYNYLADHHKYKNNYDYNLAIHILNNQYYMSTDSILLVEKESIFSPISQLHYGFYTDHGEAVASLADNPDLQCLVGNGLMPFGEAQHPGLGDFADGVDTMEFLAGIQKK